MDDLIKLLLRIFDHEIFTDYPYFWIALIVVVIAFTPLLKNVINATVYFPAFLAGIIAGHLIYYAHEYDNPIGFIIGIPFIILSGYLFNKFRGKKFIK